MIIKELFFIYGTIILEFLLELYLFYYLITLKLKKKEGFVLKIIISLAILLILSFGISIFYYYFGNSVWGRVLVYSSLFGLSIFQLKYCYDESVWTIILCSTFGYALQNLVYKTNLTIWTMCQWYNLFGWLDPYIKFDIYYRAFYFGLMTLDVFLIYKICISKIKDKISNTHLKYQLLIVGLFVLVISNILCSLEDVYFSYLDFGRENEYNEYVYYILRQTGNVFSVVCCSIVIILIFQALEKDDLKQKIEYLKHTIRAAERQYEISRDTIELINIKCHDIKYKIEASLNNDKQDFKEIHEMISIYDSKIETGNKLLDVLFTEKSLYCEQNNILFSAMIDGTKLSFIEDGDLYCLFGNLMDNALEAVTKIENKEKRIINITVKCKDDMLIIQQDNYFDGNINFDDEGLPITSKNDKKYHGFGVQSMKILVKKYKGIFTTYTEEDIFHLNILFNLNGHCLQNK